MGLIQNSVMKQRLTEELDHGCVLFVQHISKNGCRDIAWTPVKNLAFTADVNGTHLDQKYSGTILSLGTQGLPSRQLGMSSRTRTPSTCCSALSATSKLGLTTYRNPRRETAGVLLCVLTRKTGNGESHPKYPPWWRVLNQAVCRFFGASHQGENDA
jgi:hypothetical protein